MRVVKEGRGTAGAMVSGAPMLRASIGPAAQRGASWRGSVQLAAIEMTIPKVARRVYFPAFKETAWEEVALPGAGELEAHEAVVRVMCSVVSAGTELAIFGGTHVGFRTAGATYPRMPFRPGYASAGVIEAVGSGVREWRVGDRVSGATRHEDWAVVDTRRPTMVRLPEQVSFEQGCVARLAQIPMQGVRLAKVRLGEQVGVFGQGLIGQLARQCAQLDGAATTVAIDLVEGRLEVARADGASHTINPKKVDDLQGAIKEATGGHGLDVAIEATGAPPVINDALKAAADLGRVILLGSPRGKVEIDVYGDIHRKGVSLIGAHARTADVAPNMYHRWSTQEQHGLAVELIRQGRLKTERLVTDRVMKEEALGVWKMLMEQAEGHLGVVICWDQ